MTKRRTFVDRVLAGEIYNLDKIDDDIAIWSRSKEPEAECELHEWLGLTEKEYDLFVEKPESLKVILSARKYGTDVFSTLAANNNAFALAARGADPKEAEQIISWLRQTGRL
jgi:hypothetical protein